MSLEFPMFSPFQPAKLYHGFVYDEEDDKQFVNFVYHKKIKWVIEDQTRKGTFQPVSGLVIKDGKFRIKTNSLEQIDAGDFIELKHPNLKDRYFKVAEAPVIDGIYCPKYRQTYQHILLTTTSKNEINPTRSENNG